MLKKLILFSVISLSITTHASAAQSLQKEPGFLATNRWETGLSVFYIRTYSAFHRYTFNNTKYVEKRYSNPPLNFGFELQTRYFLTNETDMTLNFYRLVGKNSADNRDFDTKSYKLNLELGQQFKFSPDAHGRLFAGIQALYHLSSEVYTAEDQVDYNYNNFRGLGPRLGSDLKVDLPKGFQAFAEGAVSMLVGEGKGHVYQKNAGYYDKSVLKQTQLIPGIDAKLGISFQDHLKNGLLTLSAGWMLNHYFGLITMPGSGGKGTSLTESGPFINVRWSFDDKH